MTMTTVRPLSVISARVPFGPSEVPAAELPEYVPTDSAIIKAVELFASDVPDERMLNDSWLLDGEFPEDDELDGLLLEDLVFSAREHKRAELHRLCLQAAAASAAELDRHITAALNLIADTAPTDLKIGSAA